MESYVEAAFIHNFLTDLLSVWMALYLVQRPLHGGRVALYALCTSAWSSFVFLEGGWLGAMLIEAAAFVMVFYRQAALYGVNLLMRTLWHATAFVFWEGSFHLGAFFPWIHTPIWICWIFYLVVFIYLRTHAMTLMRQRFVYGCTLYGTQTIRLKGYMDSGNLMQCQHQPVVFVNARYEPLFEGNATTIEVHSIHGARKMKAYRILCEVDGCRKCHVFAVFVDGLALRRNCAMILNLKMLSMR